MEENVKLSGDVVSHFMVYVDSADSGILSGMFFNDYMDKPANFCDLTQLFLLMDSWSNKMNCPKEYFEPRYFVKEEEEKKSRQAEEIKPLSAFQKRRNTRECGNLATFKIDILFRQNASWQGNISWQEKRSQVSYRSLLELMRIIVSAVLHDGKQFS